MAGGTSDRVGMAARHDVQDFLLVGNLRHRQRERRIDVAEQEIDLVVVDQLPRLLHRRAGVAAGGILDHQLDVSSENSALGVDLLGGELHADEFVLARSRVGAGQRIVDPDLNAVGGARA